MIGLALLLSAPGAPAIVVPPVPRARLQSLISVDDYPPAAQRETRGGTTRVLLDVGPMGRVTACRVLASSGTAALDSATCRILSSRARFTPAIDSTGAAATAPFETEVTWAPPLPIPRRELNSPR